MRFVFVCAALSLLVPATASAKPVDRPPAAQSGRVHVVRPNQTLGKIAKLYGVTIQELCRANGIRQTTPIRPKQRLQIPGKDEPQARAAERGTTRAGSPTASTATPNADGRRRTTSANKSGEPDAKAGKAQPAKTRAPKAEDYAKRPKQRGYVTLQGNMGTWQGQVLLSNGAISPAARRGFTKVLASWRNGASEPIHGQLIRMIAKISDHFGGRPIHVVSGYRPYSPKQHTPHSRHNEGRALDFSVTGVPNAVVRDFCRTLGNVGVGYYPNSSFVHLDVREAPTYWIDYAGPGQSPRYAHARRAKAEAVPAVLTETLAPAPVGPAPSEVTHEKAHEDSAVESSH